MNKGYNHNSFLLMVASVTCTFVVLSGLCLVKLPHNAVWLMPNWWVLGVLYWIIAMPGMFGSLFAMITGIIIDLLLCRTLGMTSLILIPVAFFADRLCFRFKAFTNSQQLFMVIVLVALAQLVNLWLYAYIDTTIRHPSYWLSIVTSVIVWPVVCILLNSIRKLFRSC